MLDDLRHTTDKDTPVENEPVLVKRPRKASDGRFLGMTASQRFIVALFLFLVVCVLGSFCLLVANKVVLPFF
jgi:hypothetical protein